MPLSLSLSVSYRDQILTPAIQNTHTWPRANRRHTRRRSAVGGTQSQKYLALGFTQGFCLAVAGTATLYAWRRYTHNARRNTRLSLRGAQRRSNLVLNFLFRSFARNCGNASTGEFVSPVLRSPDCIGAEDGDFVLRISNLCKIRFTLHHPLFTTHHALTFSRTFSLKIPLLQCRFPVAVIIINC